MTTTPARLIDLVTITTLDELAQMRVREIRNEPNVRKWMYTDHVISESEHLAWIEGLRSDPRQLVFVVLDQDRTTLGVVSVNAMDRRHRRADWAFYLTEQARGGLGSVLEFTILDFVFDTLGMEKLNCEVIEGNDPVVSLHKRFGFHEEGFRRSNVLKDGNRIGIHLLGMTVADWRAARPALRERLAEKLARFEVRIRHAAADGAPT